MLIPCHVEGELHPWTRSTALSFAAELDGHVFGTLCAVTMCESLCPLQGYNLALCDLPFIEYLVVELDYGKMSATDLSSFDIALQYLKMPELL